MSMEAAQAYTRTAMEAIKTKALEEKYADYKAENEKFLADNCDFGNCYSDFKFDCVHSDFDWLVERQECRSDEIIEFIEI